MLRFWGFEISRFGGLIFWDYEILRFCAHEILRFGIWNVYYLLVFLRFTFALILMFVVCFVGFTFEVVCCCLRFTFYLSRAFTNVRFYVFQLYVLRLLSFTCFVYVLRVQVFLCFRCCFVLWRYFTVYVLAVLCLRFFAFYVLREISESGSHKSQHDKSRNIKIWNYQYHKSQNLKIAKYQISKYRNLKISQSQDFRLKKITKSQNIQTSKFQNLKNSQSQKSK